MVNARADTEWGTFSFRNEAVLLLLPSRAALHIRKKRMCGVGHPSGIINITPPPAPTPAPAPAQHLPAEEGPGRRNAQPKNSLQHAEGRTAEAVWTYGGALWHAHGTAVIGQWVARSRLGRGRAAGGANGKSVAHERECWLRSRHRSRTEGHATTRIRMPSHPSLIKSDPASKNWRSWLTNLFKKRERERVMSWWLSMKILGNHSQSQWVNVKMGPALSSQGSLPQCSTQSEIPVEVEWSPKFFLPPGWWKLGKAQGYPIDDGIQSYINYYLTRHGPSWSDLWYHDLCWVWSPIHPFQINNCGAHRFRSIVWCS